MTESLVFDVVFDETAALDSVPVVDVFTVEGGPPGLSAYQVAVLNGFSGTQAQWLASLKGADGASDPAVISAAVSDYLTTHSVFPPQTGQTPGSVLSTDGSEASWEDITPPVTLTLLLDNALV